MHIEKIDDRRIVISLSDKDMQNCGVTFETLGLNSSHSREVLRSLLNDARTQTGISFSGQRVLVEALQYEHGCLLLLTFSGVALGRKTYRIKKHGTDRIYRFDNADDFLACLLSVSRLHGTRCDIAPFLRDMTAFLHRSRYYLVCSSLSEPPEALHRLLCEFSAACRRSRLLPAVLREHAQPLSLNDFFAHRFREYDK